MMKLKCEVHDTLNANAARELSLMLKGLRPGRRVRFSAMLAQCHTSTL